MAPNVEPSARGPFDLADRQWLVESGPPPISAIVSAVAALPARMAGQQ